ncbi:cell wall-binding repeat-containing protein [Catenulispora yoronensis]
MGSTRRIRRRAAAAAILSSLAVAGVVAEAGAASAGVGPLDMSMTFTTHQQAAKDWLGDLTAPLPKHGPLEVGVGFSAGTPTGSGATITSVSFSCDWVHKPVAPLPGITPGSRVNGSADCSYDQPGFYEVTVSASSSDGLTYSDTMNITVKAPVALGVDRYYGLSRYGTAIGLTQQEFSNTPANAVVLARGDEFADALAGIPLAKAKNAALLLTPGGPGVTNLDATVQTRLNSVLAPGNIVYILGGTSAIPTAVENQVKGMGYKVVRLAGSTRTGTALAIATDPRALNNPAHIVVARGDDFADALAAARTPPTLSPASPAPLTRPPRSCCPTDRPPPPASTRPPPRTSGPSSPGPRSPRSAAAHRRH